MKKLLGLFLIFIFTAVPVLASTWTVTYNQDIDIGEPYLQCSQEGYPSTAMSENDEWFYVAIGALSPGESVVVQHPRLNCYSSTTVRLAWRWLGNGKAPTPLTLTITDPVGGAQFRDDFEETVQFKNNTPIWVHHCTQVGGLDSLGQYIFTLTNNGTKTINDLRMGAAVLPAETSLQQCNASGQGWPPELTQRGI